MALTDHCDVFASVHEDGINRVVRHLMMQRPSLFNYGTQVFAADPGTLCRKIDAHPEVARRGNPVITVEEPLPIPGTGGSWGLDFCVQLTRAEIDFHPGNAFALPPELDPLPEQRFAFHAEGCGAIACPRRELVERLGDQLADQPITLPGQKDPTGARPTDPDRPRPPIRPIPGGEPLCFCLEIFGVGHFEVLTTGAGPVLAGRLDGLEIVDIRPEGLESNLECYLATIVRLALLPRLRVSLDTLLFELGSFATLTVSPTPTSADVPHNPSVDEDQLKVFVDVGVSP